MRRCSGSMSPAVTAGVEPVPRGGAVPQHARDGRQRVLDRFAPQRAGEHAEPRGAWQVGVASGEGEFEAMRERHDVERHRRAGRRRAARPARADCRRRVRAARRRSASAGQVGSRVEQGVRVDERERGEVQPLDLLDLDRVTAGASRHHDDDRIRRDAPRHHEQRLPRGRVHPVQILADDEQRMPSRRVREQGESSHAGEEGRRRLTVPHAEGDIQCIALRLRQLGNAVAQGAQQQVQTGEGGGGLVREPRRCAAPAFPARGRDARTRRRARSCRRPDRLR